MAEKSPTNTGDSPVSGIFWENVTNADTFGEAAWDGGDGYVEVRGTLDSATIQMQFGLTTASISDLDTSAPPDGVGFTAGAIMEFSLPKGKIKFTASGGGASQDVDVVVRRKNWG